VPPTNKMKPSWPRRSTAVFGPIVTSVMILVKVVPVVPGHFTSHEWIALAIWGVLGAAVRASRNRDAQPAPLIEVASAER
jgi:hypothetical protein